METHLLIDVPKNTFQPTEIICGKILWAVPQPPKEVILTLGWATQGRGTVDEEIESELTWVTSELAGEEPFEFQLPASPYSFSGQLISLRWFLQLSTRKGKHMTDFDIVVSPNGAPVDLPHIHESRKKSFSFFRNR